MEQFEVHAVIEKIMATIQKEYQELETLNVMILGKTGVGKSTLINNMFNQDLAETGIGKPVTQRIRKITKPGFPLAIYDTPGLELGGENGINVLLEEVIDEIDRGICSGKVSNAIHCIWYCISTPSHRFEQAEIDFLKEFLGKTSKYNVPVIVVLTQSYSKSDAKLLMREIEKENLPIVNVVSVLAEDYCIDEEFTVKAYGLDTLSEIVNYVVPAAVQKTFIAVQKVNLELKNIKAQKIISTSAAAAGALGCAPIPISDIALLFSEQILMLGAITALYGVQIEKGTIMLILGSFMGAAGITLTGQTVVASLLKLIPGIGAVAGGAVSGAASATLIIVIGQAYTTVMSMLCKGQLSLEDLKTDRGKKEMRKIFKDKLRETLDAHNEPEGKS